MQNKQISAETLILAKNKLYSRKTVAKWKYSGDFLENSLFSKNFAERTWLVDFDEIIISRIFVKIGEFSRNFAVL